jgi:hypothetical protein
MSRLDKLKEQHPDLNISIIDVIAKVDPSDSYKYTEFLIKWFKEWYDDKLYLGIELIGEENVVVLNEFEKHSKCNRIEKKDIGQHKSFKSLKIEVEKADEIVKLKELEKQTKKIYDDGDWLAIIPLSFEASKSYGSNTKWCTTQEDHWDRYIKNYKLIYLIQRSSDVKYAISSKKDSDTEIQAWLNNDDEVSPMLLDIPFELFMACNTEIKKNETNLKLMGGDVDKEIPNYSALSAMFKNQLNMDYDNIREMYDNIVGKHCTNNLDNIESLDIWGSSNSDTNYAYNSWD